MMHPLSKAVVWVCTIILLLYPIFTVYFAIDLGSFKPLIHSQLKLPIQWETVTTPQWYGVWLLTALYHGIGVVGIVFLAKAFKSFTNDELFTLSNSKNIRTFAVFMFVQALCTPIHYALCSLALSLNHPPGEKMLAISIGSGEAKAVAMAAVMWVISELLLRANIIESENNQIV